MNTAQYFKGRRGQVMTALLAAVAYFSVRGYFHISVQPDPAAARTVGGSRFPSAGPARTQPGGAPGDSKRNESRGRLPAVVFQAASVEALSLDSAQLSAEWLQVFAATDSDRQLIRNAYEVFLTAFRKVESSKAKVVQTEEGESFIALDPFPVQEMPEFAAFSRQLVKIIGENHANFALNTLLRDFRHGGKDAVQVYFQARPDGNLQLTYTTPGRQIGSSNQYYHPGPAFFP